MLQTMSWQGAQEERPTKTGKESELRKGNVSQSPKIEEHIKKTNEILSKSGQKKESNISAKPSRSHRRNQSATFAKTKYTHDVGGTDIEVTVDIATTHDIISVYMLLFVPLIMGWAYYFHQATSCSQPGLYLLLLQFSVLATTVGGLLVNQSLSVLMRAPMSLTCVQAFSMFAMFSCAVLAQQVRNGLCPDPSGAAPGKPGDGIRRQLLMWSPAALCFSLYQVADHLVFNECSLSERTIFSNLNPALTLLLEASLSPVLQAHVSDRTSASYSSRMALFLTVFGALLFGVNDPDFTWLGIEVSICSSVAHVIYRVAQRYILDRIQQASTIVLVSWDGFLLALPTFALSLRETTGYWYLTDTKAWEVWLSDSSIVTMLALSLLNFGMAHFFAIQLTKVGTATLTVVMGNIGASICLFQGLVFFGDEVFKTPYMFIGICFSIAGGFWYAACQWLADSNKECEQQNDLTTGAS
eukprot:TRINITY_DN20161_c0_g2_i1.p1 TRINITY_DN20161_c0_g2~~TRINITY_DN20161_c0_g2_i1.p1  ORF type:complete len:536 (-),score=71.23 TRINITY_DN20161_c0_g2_i1:27-1433(-)